MTTTSTATGAAGASGPARPGVVGRLRSRQAGHPSGWLGRVIGRLMVKDTAEANDRAIALLGLTGSATVLEVGFGQGRTVAQLVGAGHRVLGVDVSATMVAQAAALNRRACADGRVRLEQGEGITIAFDDDVANAALTVHTVYFMPDPAMTFAEMARVLRPGGRLAVACRVADDPVPAWMDPSVYRVPTVEQVRSLFEQAGFHSIAHHPGSAETHHTHWFTGDVPR